MFVGTWDNLRSRVAKGFVLGLLAFLFHDWVNAAPIPRGVSVAWATNTDPDLAGYYIYYGPSIGVYTGRIQVPRTASTTRIEPLTPGGIYCLMITAFNTA